MPANGQKCRAVLSTAWPSIGIYASGDDFAKNSNKAPNSNVSNSTVAHKLAAH